MRELFGGEHYTSMSQSARSLLRRVQGSLLVALFIYKLLTTWVVFPFLQLLWSIALRLGPDNYVASHNLSNMLRSPATLVAGVLIAVLFSLWILYEYALVICGLSYARTGERCRLLPLLRDAGLCTVRALQPRNWLVLVLVAFLVPVANLFSESDIVTQLSIPYYIYEVIVDKPLTAGLYWVARAVLILFTLRWLLLVHYYVLERRTVREARRESVLWLREHPWQTITGLLRWLVRVVVRIAIATVLMAGVGILLLLLVGIWNETAMGYLLESGVAITYPFLKYVLQCMAILMQQAYISAEYYNRSEGRPLVFDETPDGNQVSRRRSRVIILATCVGAMMYTVGIAYLTWYVETQDSSIAEIYDSDGIQVTSHRGYSSVAPENTIPAFESAIAAGADCGELDVQMTSDGVVVLTHDTNLARTTGCNANVYDLTYEEVAALDAGSHFSEAFAGTQIPTLDEVIKTCKGKLRLNIEIKSNEHTPTLAAETVRIIEENDFADECVVTSLDYDTLVAVKEASEDITTGYIMPLALGNYYDLEAVDFFSLEGTFVTADVVWQANSRGKTVSVWTMDREADIRRMIRIGVDDLITDDPVTTRQIVNEYNDMDDLFYQICDRIRGMLAK